MDTLRFSVVSGKIQFNKRLDKVNYYNTQKNYFCMLMTVYHNELASRPTSNAEASNLVLACPQLIKTN